MYRPAFVLLFLLSTPAALAQRTSNNAVIASDDAFGRAIGNERIGIYSQEDIRGFNPIEAGNARIEGLYFDQVSITNNRLIDSSSVRVGYTAQAWPFPAPTGIVNLELEKADKDAALSVEGEVDADGNYATILQAKLPIAGDKLGLSLGNGQRRARAPAWRYVNFVGHAANLTWRPGNGVETNLFWSHFRSAKTGGTPIFFPSGNVPPPKADRKRYLGQLWAQGLNHGHTLGLTTKVPLGDWRFDIGLFRSINDQNFNFANLAVGIDQQGIIANERILAERDQYVGSTSGEARLERRFVSGGLQHRVTATLRGRQQRRQFGGQASIPLGTTSIFARPVVAAPPIIFGPKNQARVRQFTPGIAYELASPNGLHFGASVLRSDYRRSLDLARQGSTRVVTRAKPWHFAANATVPIAEGLRLYGGYVEGFEESPVAPDIATNSNEAPPAARTRQMDAGVRYAITPKLTLITGAFRIEKPYYNLDANGRYGVLGEITNQGLEFSLAGSLAKGLNLVAGGLILDPKLSGSEVESGRIGKRPTGAARRRGILNLDYRPGGTSPVSFDLALDAQAGVAANAKNLFQSPARETITIGTRYRFDAAGAKWLVRGQVINLFNDYGWRVSSSGGFNFTQPRQFLLTVAADL